MMSTLFFTKQRVLKILVKNQFAKKITRPSLRTTYISLFTCIYICPLVNAFTAGVSDGVSYTVALHTSH